ncbi:universal stress protein [Gaetbulibacter saemankumensis]|uniref:universal stress protein n=1 Tax=Gaetbulibacter saemankumensis TaxID=311208 RepID=UPI0004107D81|nr:universal stress protein [Gaetbulibacter saemankumensis]
MKAILLPTDFSKNSINAINYAMELFKNESCKFYLLNVQKASSFISDDLLVVNASTTIYTTIVDAAKKSLSNVIHKIQKKFHNDKHEFESLVDYDNFSDSINQVCEKYNIDLVVMGTKGATGLQKVIFGSNTVRIMQHCPVPLLAIPSGCKFTELDKISFTTSYKCTYKISKLKILKDVIKLHKSELNVLHVVCEDDYSPELDADIDFFRAHFPNVKFDYVDSSINDVFSTVQDYVTKNNINLIAMSNKRYSFFERLFMKHIVENFAFSIDIPFLVIPKES